MLIGVAVAVAAVFAVLALVLGIMLNSSRRRLSLLMVKEVRATQRSGRSEDLALRRDAEVAMAKTATTNAERRITELEQTLEEARSATARAEEATARAEAGVAAAGVAADSAAASSAAELAGVRDQVEGLEVKLRVAERRVAAAAADAAAGALGLRRAMTAMWDLAELHQDWARRAEAELSTAPSERPELGLDGALDLEVARTREDSGTPGRLILELDADPSPIDSLIVLRTVQTLLAAVARRCDAYDLTVRSGPGVIRATLRCTGFDGGPGVVDDARTLGQVLAAAGVEAGVDDAGGGLVVTLAFPVTPGA